MSDAVRAAEALEPISATLAADGYRLSVEEGPDGVLDVRIAATDDACEECLSPRAVMQPVIEMLLEQGGVRPAGVTVRYPNEQATHP